MDESFARYSPWFLAAGLYNLIAGSAIVLFPSFFLQVLGMGQFEHVAVWQVVGMFILVYAPAYWWCSKKPFQFRHFIVIGALGKFLGPVGFIWAAGTGQLPFQFGLLILFNDLIWWPAFASFLYRVARNCGGWKALITGDL